MFLFCYLKNFSSGFFFLFLFCLYLFLITLECFLSVFFAFLLSLLFVFLFLLVLLLLFVLGFWVLFGCFLILYFLWLLNFFGGCFLFSFDWFYFYYLSWVLFDCFCYLSWGFWSSVCFLFPCFGHDAWLAGSWFPGNGLRLSPKSGSTKSQPQELLIDTSFPGGTQDSVPCNYLQAPVLVASGQTTRKTGIQPNPSANSLQKVILNSWTPQNTHPEKTWPIRGTRLSSTYQRPSTSPLYQEANINPWTNLTTRQQKQEELQPYSLWKGNHKHSNLDKMRWQRNLLKMKEQGKNSQNQITKEETGNLPEKFRILVVKVIQYLKNKMKALRRYKKHLTMT